MTNTPIRLFGTAMSSPTFKGASDVVKSSSTVALPIPTYAVGDVVVVAISSYGGSNVGVTTNTGWTLVQNASSKFMMFWYKAMTSTAESTFTWTNPGNYARQMVLVYSGVDTVTVLDNGSIVATSPTVTFTPEPAHTLDEIIVCMGASTAYNITLNTITIANSTTRYLSGAADNNYPATGIADVKMSLNASSVAIGTMTMDNTYHSQLSLRLSNSASPGLVTLYTAAAKTIVTAVTATSDSSGGEFDLLINNLYIANKMKVSPNSLLALSLNHVMETGDVLKAEAFSGKFSLMASGVTIT